MSYRSRAKERAGAWHRKSHTGFIRPQRKFHKAKMRMYRKLQAALRQQMKDRLQEAGISPGVVEAQGPQVKELWDGKQGIR